MKDKKKIIRNYRDLFFKHGDSAEAVKFAEDSQKLRFEKLVQIGNLKGKRILDVGCGLGHFFPFLLSTFGCIDYSGIDIVKESVDFAARKYPDARFQCLDLLEEPLMESFDYGLINGVFNDNMSDSNDFLKELISVVYSRCNIGLGFNFISTYVNFIDETAAYHDPVDILEYCLKNLSKKVILNHHYNKCDVVIFVYR